MQRYSVINEKNKREIVLLRGKGCGWRKCRFCDYHLDYCTDQIANHLLNKVELEKVTGIHKKLEIINSGSFVELPTPTMDLIEKLCVDKNIKELHFESHWHNIEGVLKIKDYFSSLEKPVDVKVKIGVETFDYLFRESYLVKGIDEASPEKIAQYFNECCLLQGIPGQTHTSMIQDIEIGLKYFERVCVNIMQDNGMPIKPDPKVIEQFEKYVLPIYIDNDRVDILMENTAFGVGGVTTNAISK
ncbi:MAG: radical SAM protein [Candidatus Epulonipiscioides saccharophilum]|nr:MAG: radical SAM protein [Epulopiscium sp. AS2M-Bin001]